jgi:predicted nucleotidyltransferase
VLAIEYLRALKRLNSRLTPITVKREGAGYNDAFSSGTSFQSASAIRERMRENDSSALDYVPENARNIYFDAISSGELTTAAPLDASVISYFRLNPPTDVEYHDCAGGLNYRLADASLEANTISSLIGLAQTKKYTAARIRRAVFNSYFGVTSSEILCYPRYTQVLAMNAKGASILKKAKKMTKIAVITKPSSYTEYGEDVARQKLSSVKADSVFALTVGGGRSGRTPLTFTPYVKKQQKTR